MSSVEGVDVTQVKESLATVTENLQAESDRLCMQAESESVR